jgi:hypothetical protein
VNSRRLVCIAGCETKSDPQVGARPEAANRGKRFSSSSQKHSFKRTISAVYGMHRTKGSNASRNIGAYCFRSQPSDPCRNAKASTIIGTGVRSLPCPTASIRIENQKRPQIRCPRSPKRKTVPIASEAARQATAVSSFQGETLISKPRGCRRNRTAVLR